MDSQAVIAIEAMNYLRYNHAPSKLHPDKHPYATNYLAFTGIKCRKKAENQWSIYIDDAELIKRAGIDYQEIINENPKFVNTYKWFDNAVIPTAKYIADKLGGNIDA